MQDQLMSGPKLPTSYHEYTEHLQLLGSRLDGRELRRKRKNHHPPARKSDQSPAPTPTPAPAAEMEWEATKVSQARSAVDQALRGKRAKWVSQQELDKRRAEKRCFRCGRSDCRLERCPLKPARPPTSTSTSTTRVTRATPVTEAAVEELVASDQSTDEAENE